MKLQENYKKLIIELICFLYALLFVYAAVSKLVDFERFQVQLAQSPVLSIYAEWISYFVIGFELIISGMLLFSATRIIGLYAAFVLMSMFTSYIFIVLHYSSFIPCSCGGILEKMSWNTHLIFNSLFVMLAIVAIIIHKNKRQDDFPITKNSSKIWILLASAIMATTAVVILFVSSEQAIHHKNPFVRRYPKKAIELDKTIDLRWNSYYFAGYEKNILYLANYTDPLHLLSIDSDGKQKRIKLYLDYRNQSFKSIKIVVQDGWFYLFDGTLPRIYRGNTKDWKLTAELKRTPKFSLAQPMDSVTIAFRNNTGNDRANVIGIFSAEKDTVLYSQNLLKRQIDGIFDTDGILLYNQNRKQIHYIYYYRNEFITADRNGELMRRSNTIDTNKQAKIKVAYLKNNTERQMAAPPLKVNSISAVRNNLLFINSKVPGRFEDEKFWKKSSVVDVYNLDNNSYVLSFYVQEIPNQKIQNIFVTDDHLYVTAGTNLMVFNLGYLLKSEMKRESELKTDR